MLTHVSTGPSCSDTKAFVNASNLIGNQAYLQACQTQLKNTGLNFNEIDYGFSLAGPNRLGYIFKMTAIVACPVLFVIGVLLCSFGLVAVGIFPLIFAILCAIAFPVAAHFLGAI
jgi:hypothetical protein